MIKGLVQILGFQLLGEALAHISAVPVSGPVLGMALLLLFLLASNGPGEELRQAGEGLLKYLPLLFVPAGVGAMLYLDLLRQQWLAVLLALVVSTVLSLGFMAWLMQVLMRMQEKKRQGP